MSSKCENCNGQLVDLETFVTDTYSNGAEWFMDIKKRCVCNKCSREQEITVETIKQDRWFK